MDTNLALDISVGPPALSLHSYLIFQQDHQLISAQLLFFLIIGFIFLALIYSTLNFTNLCIAKLLINFPLAGKLPAYRWICILFLNIFIATKSYKILARFLPSVSVKYTLAYEAREDRQPSKIRYISSLDPICIEKLLLRP